MRTSVNLLAAYHIALGINIFRIFIEYTNQHFIMRGCFLKGVASNPAENYAPARWWGSNIQTTQAILDLSSTICSLISICTYVNVYAPHRGCWEIEENEKMYTGFILSSTIVFFTHGLIFRANQLIHLKQILGVFLKTANHRVFGRMRPHQIHLLVPYTLLQV